MAKITTITNPLTGQPAQVDQLDHTAQQIDDAIARALPGGAIDSVLSSKPNPNLLDNWYFANPVNQRGQTSYTGAGYGIDRWIRYGGDTLLNDGYITLLGYSNNLDQSADKDVYKQLRGKTVTMSVLGRGNFAIVSEDYANNFLYASLQSAEFTIVRLTLTVRSDADRFVFHIQPQDGNPCDIIATKLELGSQQTLAHQENGVWVLNEIPDYGEQLRRCQRYYYQTWTGASPKTDNGYIGFNAGTNNSTPDVFRPPVTMRTTPSVTVYNPLTGNESCVADYNSDAEIAGIINYAGKTTEKVIMLNHTQRLTNGRKYICHLKLDAEIH